MITNRKAAALAGLGLALALSACSSTDISEASDTWCEGAATVASEVEKMEALIDDGSSGELVKAQWNSVEAAIQANSVPLTQLANAVQEDVTAAYDTLGAAVDAVPDDAAPSEAAPQYKAAIDEFKADMQTIEDEVGCA